jgi:hypothetical protein
MCVGFILSGVGHKKKITIELDEMFSKMPHSPVYSPFSKKRPME